MSDAQRYLYFTREDFEAYLFMKHNAFLLPPEFYKYNWQIIKSTGEFIPRKKEIKEFVYAIQFNRKYGVLIYTGIDINYWGSREAGEDAIRLVPIALSHLRPIHTKEKRINRIATWTYNFEKRMLNIVEQLGYKKKCYQCKRIKVLQMNSRTKLYYLKCPKCFAFEKL